MENPQNFANVRISPKPLPHVRKCPLLRKTLPFCEHSLWTVPNLYARYLNIARAFWPSLRARAKLSCIHRGNLRAIFYHVVRVRSESFRSKISERKRFLMCCIQDTLSSRAALGLPLGRVRRASKGVLHTTSGRDMERTISVTREK